jgi:hypothetical protein
VVDPHPDLTVQKASRTNIGFSEVIGVKKVDVTVPATAERRCLIRTWRVR